MELALTAEQIALGDSERSWLSHHDPLTRVRETLDRSPISIDPASLARSAESGTLALLTPEVGGTHMDLGVLTEAHGWAASSLPLADLAIATWLLSRVGVPPAAIDGSGRSLVGVARGPAASTEGDVLRITGTTRPIPMAPDMASFAVIGSSDDSDYLAVLSDAALIPMTTLDLTRTWARLDIDATITDWTQLPTGTYQYVSDALAVHRAIDAVGAVSRLLDMTVAYAGQREQFGAPIGSFQAVKHHCANMAVAVEASRSVVRAAALALDDAADATRSRAASAAAAYAKSAASQAAGTALQVHGGIGFTWEHDLHLLLRRIKVDEAFDGTVAEHRAALVPAGVEAVAS